ncbi:hypothetical protein PG990_013410 [Apiospora arundinis]
MGCFNSKSAKELDGREVAIQYRTILINKLDNPRITMSKRIEVEEELDQFMGFSEREQEIYASLRLAPAQPRPRPCPRPQTVHSLSSSVGSTAKIPILVTMHETVP